MYYAAINLASFMQYYIINSASGTLHNKFIFYKNLEEPVFCSSVYGDDVGKSVFLSTRNCR